VQARFAELRNQRLRDATLALGFFLESAHAVEQRGGGIQQRLSLRRAFSRGERA
jgi:hypothetical protein